MWYLMVIPLIILIGQCRCPPAVKPGVLLGEVVLGGVFFDVNGKLIILFHVRYITAPTRSREQSISTSFETHALLQTVRTHSHLE